MKMARRETKAIRGALLRIAADIENEGCGSDKLRSFASLVNSYHRMLQAENNKPKRKAGGDPINGDPTHHSRLLRSSKN
jgi:hypothetical protein